MIENTNTFFTFPEIAQVLHRCVRQLKLSYAIGGETVY